MQFSEVEFAQFERKENAFLQVMNET